MDLNLRALIVISLLLLAFLWVGGRQEKPLYAHPPTYEDFARSTEDVDMALFTATQLTPEDLAFIQDSGKVDCLMGAAAVDDSEDSEECLRRALLLHPPQPEMSALVCYRAERMHWAPKDYLAAIQEWEKIDPDNLAPLCLEAAYHIKAGDNAAADQCLSRMPKCEFYNFYSNRIRADIITAAESVGYSRMAACHLPLGWSPPFLPHSILHDYLKEHPNGAQYREFIHTKLLSANFRLISEGMIAGYYSTEQSAPERQRRLLEYLRTFDTSDLSEERWVAYFEQVYSVGEMAAIQTLYDERKGQPGSHKEKR